MMNLHAKQYIKIKCKNELRFYLKMLEWERYDVKKDIQITSIKINFTGYIFGFNARVIHFNF